MISVVTPSFRQVGWLRLCVASVADQEGVEVEHIVQDGGTEGLSAAALSPAPPNPTYKLHLHAGKDSGMYDAINRGLSYASGDLCAYLNCDEQYLPGALARVQAEFARNPDTDVLLAGSLVVDGGGKYHCSRPALKPSLRDLRGGRMYNLSSGMFFRSSLFRERDHFFDASLRIVGDMDWLRRVMEAGSCVRTADFFTSTFADLGTNLALSGSAPEETGTANGRASLFAKLGSASTLVSHRIRRLLAGHYHQQPFDYSIYTLQDPKSRRAFRVDKPTGVWRNRL